MDSQYGIAVTNKFQLFLDEDADPYDILKQQEELKKKQELSKEKEKGKPGKSKQAKKNVLQTETKNKPTEQSAPKREDKPNNQLQSRQNDRPPRSARQNRDPKESRDDVDRRPRRRDENVPPEFREKQEGGPPSSGGFNRPDSGRVGSGGFGRGRGRGGRGRGRGGFGDRGGKRDFERHSGSDRTSGVKATEKREGSGSHNWGSFKDDMEDQMKEGETESREWNAQEETENQDPNESTESTEAPADDTPHQMTLDEWKAQQEKRRMKTQFNIRKPGEGEGGSQWKKGVVYRKKKEDGDDDEETDEEEEDYEDEDAMKQKNLMNNLKFVFSDSPRRGRGGRRMRGSRGGRGGGNRGDRRGGPRDTAPKFDDENDFPSLVKTEA